MFLTQQCLGVNTAMTHCCLWHPALDRQVQLVGMWEPWVFGSKWAMHAKTLTNPVKVLMGSKADAWT